MPLDPWAYPGISAGAVHGTLIVDINAEAEAARLQAGPVPASGTVELVAVAGTRTSFVGTTALIDAVAAAVTGDVVYLGPGTYAESVTVPAGVVVQGSGTVTTISGAAAIGTRLTLGAGSEIRGLMVQAPNDATYAILMAVAGTAVLRDVSITGTGALGIGIGCTAGVIVLGAVRYLSGVIGTFVVAASGTITGADVALLGGTATIGFDVSGAGTLRDIGGWNIAAAATVTDGLRVANGVVEAWGGVSLNATNALHITDDAAMLHLGVVNFEGGTFDLVVDAAVTTAELHILSGHLSTARLSVPTQWLRQGDFAAATLDERPGDEGLWIIGELHIGTPECPRELVAGEGDSTTRGMVVLTTDDTAAAGDDGGNLTDVSVAAASVSGSTVTFQGLGAGHSILFGSALVDAAGAALKHWGLKAVATVARVAGTVVFEIWNGAAWTGIGHMSTDSDDHTRYADTAALRANTEQIRYGVDPATTWAAKAIDGTMAFWSRIRVTGLLTTAPIWEQFKLHTNRTEINGNGMLEYYGASRTRLVQFVGGNIFGEEGAVGDTTIAVGAGGVPTGWTHRVKNSDLNTNNDGIHWQTRIPSGADTSVQMRVRIYYTLVGAKPTVADDVDLILSVLPVEVVGIQVADPAGGVASVARTAATTDALAANAALTTSMAVSGLVVEDGKVIVLEASFDLGSWYEGDLVLMRLELDDDGNPAQNVLVFIVEASFAVWSAGELT